MTFTRLAGTARAIATATVVALIAVLALAGVAQPSQAAPAASPVTGATLNWAIHPDFLEYITGPTGGTDGVVTPLGGVTQPGGGENPFVWGGGAGELAADEVNADVSYTGGVQFQKHAAGPTGYGLDLQLTNPRIVITSATTGEVYLDLKQGAGAVATTKFANLALTTPAVSGGVVSYTGVTGTLTTEGATFLNYQSDPAKQAISPLTFTFPYTTVATTTALDLQVSPATTSVAGTPVTLTAQVSPTAAGSVEFFNGAISLGAEPVDGSGVATKVLPSLPAGDYTFNSAFSPADATQFTASVSLTVNHQVTVNTDIPALNTEVALAVSPAAQVLKADSALQFTATVTAPDDDAATPVGKVLFFAQADGAASEVQLGEVAVTSGVATFSPNADSSSELAGGAHSITAQFVPTTADFNGSTSAASTVRVVDVAGPTLTEPGANASTATDAAFAWTFNQYSLVNTRPSAWPRSTSGTNASVVDSEFQITSGAVTSDAHSARVAFEGTLTFTIHYLTLSLTDPYVILNPGGQGALYATVNLENSQDNTVETLTDVLISTFTTPQHVVPGFDGTVSLPLDYADVAAPGTWSNAQTDSWANEFIWHLDPSIRAYFYRTGAGVSQDNKGADPLTLTFEWPYTTELELSATPGVSAPLGAEVTLVAEVTPAVSGDLVRFEADNEDTGLKTVLGTEAVQSDGKATLTTSALSAGHNEITATLLPGGGEPSDLQNTINRFAVVDLTEPALCTPGQGALSRSGVSATWDWSEYASDWTKIATGNVELDLETFVLKDGVATYTDDCVSVSFTGKLRIAAYEGFFPPDGQFVELVDPTLTLDAEGNGAWSAGLRSGDTAYNAQAPAPRKVVATITGAESLNFAAEAFQSEIALDYTDTTAVGTWSKSRSDAWANGFIDQAPSAIRSFFYATGAGGDVRKAPAPITLSWSKSPLTVDVSVPGGEIRPGQKVTFTGDGFATGEQVSATVYSDPLNLGVQTANAAGRVIFTWTVPADFVGNHRIELSGVSGTISRAFTVLPSAIVPVPEEDPEPVCVARAVNGANLNWGVKESFRTYISSPVAHGQTTVSGVSRTSNGFRWNGGKGSYNTDANRGRISYSGSVTFSGHGGQLELTLRNPRIQVNSSTSATLIVDVQSKSLQGPPVNARGIAFGTIRLSKAQASGNSISWSNAPVTLTTAGAEAFGGFYTAGTALDTISFSFPLGAEVDCDRGSADAATLARTGGSLELAWAVLALLGMGGAAVLVSRRRLAGQN